MNGARDPVLPEDIRSGLMNALDCQIEDWNRVGRTKTFGHPLNFDRLAQSLTVDSRILDYGFGYGRALSLLHSQGS